MGMPQSQASVEAPVSSKGRHGRDSSGKYTSSHSHRHRGGSKRSRTPTPEGSLSGSGEVSPRVQTRRSRSRSASGSSGTTLDSTIRAETPNVMLQPVITQAPMMVSMAKSLTDRINWSQAELLIKFDGSLTGSKQRSNANGQVVLIPGDGVHFTRSTPKLNAQIQSNMKMTSRSSAMSSPHSVGGKRYIIHQASILSAHNANPASLLVEIPNFVASESETVYYNSKGEAVNHLCIAMMPGETIKDKVVMTNKCADDVLQIYSEYPSYNQHNLREGVTNALPKNGIARLAVPHSEKKRHPVVDLAVSKLASDKNLMSKKQIKAYQESGNLPEEILTPSRDAADTMLISAAVFDAYETRVKKGMASVVPHSDMSNPYALVSRFNYNTAKYANEAVTDNRLEQVSSAKDIWTDSREIHANRTTQESKQNALTTDYGSYIRVGVLFSETNELQDRVDK